jgi:hypothetical protein
LDEVSLHPSGEEGPVDDGSTDAGLGESEGGADFTEQAARVGSWAGA